MRRSTIKYFPCCCTTAPTTLTLMSFSASGCLPCAASPVPASARNSNGCVFFACGVRHGKCAQEQLKNDPLPNYFQLFSTCESPDLPPMRGATAMFQARRGHAYLGAGFRHVCRTSPGARSLRQKRAAFSPKGCHQLPTTRRATHAHARFEQATRISAAASADIMDTGNPASLLLSCYPPAPRPCQCCAPH